MKKEQMGFSMLEVLVALLIFSVSSLGLMQLQWRSCQQIRDLYLVQMETIDEY